MQANNVSSQTIGRWPSGCYPHLVGITQLRDMTMSLLHGRLNEVNAEREELTCFRLRMEYILSRVDVFVVGVACECRNRP